MIRLTQLCKRKKTTVSKQIVLQQAPANSLNKLLSNFQPEKVLYNENYLRVVGTALFKVNLSCSNNYLVLHYL